MAFDSIENPEVITTICVGIATVLGAIATLIKKIQGKTWKELFESLATIYSKEIKEIAEVSKEAIKNVKEVAEKSKEKSKPSKSKLE